MKKQCIRVGFDLDGVILYNPARIVRPVIVLFKKIFFKKESGKFHLPQTELDRLIWSLMHKSSIFIAPGLNEIESLVRTGKIETYIVSARYEFLKKDFDRWVKKIDQRKIFSGFYFNTDNEQPYEFKEKMIKKLQLDVFVEDNWDIVRTLATNLYSQTKIYWIYNFLDLRIPYLYKFPDLRKAVKALI